MALTIEDLFRKNRFPSGLQFLIFLIYIPVGLILALLRVFIGFHAFLVATILPKTLFLRRWVLRVMCMILGVVVRSRWDDRADNENNNERTLMVANSVSVFDHLILDLLTPNYVLINKPCDGFWSWFGGYFSPPDVRVCLKDCIRYFFRDSIVDLVAFPEGTSTNGRAMLKFQDWPFDLGFSVRPVTIDVYRPTLDVAVTLADSRSWQDVFWHFFCPMTIYNVRFLPVQKKGVEEPAPDFAKRVQTLMCDAAKMANTSFTINDKKELVKRRHFEERRRKPETAVTVRPARSDDRLRTMSGQVKDVLPDVPIAVIERDLKTTKNVDLTITNLLEGITPYTPEPPGSTTTTPTTYSTSTKSSPSLSSSSPAPTSTSAAKPLSGAVPAKSFSRSPRERHLSLAERKQQLIENARARYIEKFGPQDS